MIEPKSKQTKKSKTAAATAKTSQGKAKSSGALLNKKVGGKVGGKTASGKQKSNKK